MEVSKASGPDLISNVILKIFAESISAPLAILFNKSFATGKFPRQWKIANVSPVYKKGDRSIVSNYRPVSLLSCVSKILEKLMFRVLYDFCDRNNLLTWRNSGFKKSDSAMNQIINITHKIYSDLDDGRDVCLVFLDVSKAFDRVWHDGLLFKLRCFGVSGVMLDWFQSYICDRKQRVVINGQISSLLDIDAGVPQGSIIGPLLFLIFINDITIDISAEISCLPMTHFYMNPLMILTEVIKN